MTPADLVNAGYRLIAAKSVQMRGENHSCLILTHERAGGRYISWTIGRSGLYTEPLDVTIQQAVPA